jgi:histidyl-tRNA synthetase
MSLSTQPYKGARDFFPQDKRIQDYIFGVLRNTVKKYGYQEYDAPILEPLELYKAKSGEEIVNEQTYNFTDRGGREVTLRPEMTPTVARMVASQRQELGYPLRWFSIPNLWRYERPQRGRLREHWQLNVDLFGEAGLPADHEVILVADNVLKSFGAKPDMYEIRINNRQFINYLMSDYFGLNDVQATTMCKLIDRMHKIERHVFEADVDAICSPSQKSEGLSEKIIAILAVKSIAELPEDLQAHESLQQVKSLLELLEKSGVSNARFEITVMRGLDYYNSIVFEVFDTNPENNRSMFGGGRYDGLVEIFGVEKLPVVGFGMGDVTLQNFLETHHLLPVLHPETDVLVITVGDVYEKSQHFIASLREMGINVAVDATERKIDVKLRHADKKDVRYVVFVGEKELAEGQYPLKDLKSGNEEKHSPERLVSIIKDFRR